MITEDLLSRCLVCAGNNNVVLMQRRVCRHWKLALKELVVEYQLKNMIHPGSWEPCLQARFISNTT